VSDGARLRAATVDDIDAIDALLRTVDQPPPGEPPLPPHAQDSYLRYLIEHGTAAVVDLDGTMIGFGATVHSGRWTHLADLFVVTEQQGKGHGGRLVSAVFGDRRPRTTFSSDDPRAMPLYIRAGMLPLWPNVYVSGDPASLAQAQGVAVEPSTYEEIAALDGQWAHLDRISAMAYWHTLPDGRPYVVTRGGRPVALIVGRRRLNGVGRWIDRARVAPGEQPVVPLLAGMRRAAEGGNSIGACVPGPSPLLPVLLGAGFRIRDRDVYMASDPTLLDPTLELFNTGIL
jgi:GNAT superfamily N-acetyltransferase/antitoxin (DNA-binding transcriptional repressor) of toxin-antitoxin stability system